MALKLNPKTGLLEEQTSLVRTTGGGPFTSSRDLASGQTGLTTGALSGLNLSLSGQTTQSPFLTATGARTGSNLISTPNRSINNALTLTGSNLLQIQQTTEQNKVAPGPLGPVERFPQVLGTTGATPATTTATDKTGLNSEIEAIRNRVLDLQTGLDEFKGQDLVPDSDLQKLQAELTRQLTEALPGLKPDEKTIIEKFQQRQLQSEEAAAAQ